MNKQNPNPPHITFRRIRGRIVPIVQGKKAPGATKLLGQELQDRASEIAHAEKGVRGVGYSEGEVTHSFSTKSTFPAWYSKLGFKNKADFSNTLKKKSGVKFDRLVNDSIESLSHGRTSTFGNIPASTKFRLATKQEYNNRGVIFRNIDGKVVPLRIGAEVPF